MKIRLSGIAYNSLVNGVGMRKVLFSQGCNHNCKGCFNPDTHDFNGGEEFEIDNIINETLNDLIIRGVTFSGGDPFEQADKFAILAKTFKEKGLNIWCYTGYTFDYIFQHMDNRKGWKELLYNIDILVDGKFTEELKSDKIKFRGSTNQRIIDVPRSLLEGKVITIHEEFDYKD